MLTYVRRINFFRLILGFALLFNTTQATELASGKMRLSVKNLLNNEWGMLKTPGLNLQAAWRFLVEKKLAKHELDCSKSPIVVAIIDTGVDFTHSSLQQSQWVKKDKHGWDFTTNSGLIVDGFGHGTHLAGIISGDSASPEGFHGVCPGVKIMSLRAFGTNTPGKKIIENSIKAVRYAMDNGARIINYSAGGAAPDAKELEVLKEATNRGILFVAAAGNERNDTSKRPYYPASYNLKNIISVAGIGETGTLIPLSNWGHNTVDIAAPGGGILSLQQDERYGFMNGTSQATAFVTGLAAMIWTANPKMTAEEVKKIISLSATKTPALKDKVKAEGYADAENAMKMVATFKESSKPTKKLKTKALKSRYQFISDLDFKH